MRSRNSLSCLCFLWLVCLGANAQPRTGFKYGEAFSLLAIDEKILVVGGFAELNGAKLQSFGTWILNSDGSLDDSFRPFSAVQSVGAVGTSVGMYPSVCRSGADLYFAGNHFGPPVIHRVSVKGAVDMAYSEAGSAVFRKGGGQLKASLCLPDGKLLVGGEFKVIHKGVQVQNLIRLKGDGTVDDEVNFWSKGNVGPVEDLVVLENGRILVVGKSARTLGRENGPVFLGVDVIEEDLRPTRQLNSLGSGFTEGHTALTAAVSQNGSLLIGGTFQAFDGFVEDSWGILGLMTDGSRDLRFNRNGRGITEESLSRTGRVEVIKVLDDGKILVGGMFGAYNGELNVSKGLVRLHQDGTLDRTFNQGGEGFSKNGHILTLLVDSRGRIYVGGRFGHYNGVRVPDGLIRLLPDGTFDSSFLSL